MDRPLASVVSAFSCVPRVSAVSAANSSATPRMLFTRLGSMNTATASVGRDNSAVFGSPVFPLPSATAPGDVMLIADAGAYGRSMSSEYNLRALPAEDVIDDE